MPEITVHVSAEEEQAIEKYATADGRPLSNLFMFALRVHVRRSKKRDENSKVIKLPEYRNETH